MASNANNHAQQHFHHHNASMGRIPAGAVPNNRHSRELSADNSMNSGRDQAGTYPSIHSALQASAAPFGPGMTSAAPYTPSGMASNTPATGMNNFNGYYPQNGFQGGGGGGGSHNAPPSFGAPMLATGMQQLNLNGVPPNNMYPNQNFTGYGGVPFQHAGAQSRDSQARVIQHRRQLDNEGT